MTRDRKPYRNRTLYNAALLVVIVAVEFDSLWRHQKKPSFRCSRATVSLRGPDVSEMPDWQLALVASGECT
jgi:hypothetical protein